jgi:hypothetical protein
MLQFCGKVLTLMLMFCALTKVPTHECQMLVF